MKNVYHLCIAILICLTLFAFAQEFNKQLRISLPALELQKNSNLHSIKVHEKFDWPTMANKPSF